MGTAWTCLRPPLPGTVARRRPGLLQANKFMLRKEKREHSSHFLLMKVGEEGSCPSPEQSGRPPGPGKGGSEQHKGRDEAPAADRVGEEVQNGHVTQVGLAERAGQRALTLNVHLQCRHGPGVNVQRVCIQFSGPFLGRGQGADLSQGHYYTLKARLMSVWDHESRSLVVLTHRAHL